MQIDWKALAQTEGYKSLKAAYNRDVQAIAKQGRPMRNKEEFLKKFRWVIARAQHYAVRRDTTVASVLKSWEAARDYWWMNFYRDGHMPKLPSGKPRNVRWPKPSKANSWGLTHIERFKRLRRERHQLAVKAREQKGKPARWGAARKRVKRFHRSL